MNKLFIKIDQDTPYQIADIFQNKYSGKELCYQIPSDLNISEINYLCNFFSETIINLSDYQGLNTTKPRDLFNFEVLKNNEKTDSFSDLSNYYQFNDWVIVRNGIYDESLKQNISYFEGKIVDFFNDGEQDVFFIKWRMNSLLQIPKKKIKSLIQKGISPFDTYLNSNQILPYRNPESENDLSNIHMEFFLKFAHEKFSSYWYYPKNIFLHNTQKTISINWELHFQNKFNAQNTVNALDYQKENINIFGTAGSDEKNGVWISISKNGQKLIIPLADVKRIITPDFINNDLKFYQYWASFFCQ